MQPHDHYHTSRLEVAGREAAHRGMREQEWWLAAVQEPEVWFAPCGGDTWPTTTLPAFDAVGCAAQRNDDLTDAYDLLTRIRRLLMERA